MTAIPGPTETERLAQRNALIFANVGHVFIHLFTAMYFTIALAMEQQGFLDLTYADLTPLWGVGALLVGLAAMPAGWLADRWSSTGMMAVFFLGLGGAGVACAFANGETLLWIGLTAIGLFSAIYHPVAIPWVVRNARQRGKALAFNGIFGNIGVGVAAAVAGVLSDLISWRAAFLVPSALCLGTGAALLWCWQRGRVSEGEDHRMNAGAKPPSRGDMWRGFFVLALCMACMGLIFQATQASLPKLFELRLGDTLSGLFGDGASGPALMVALVYGLGSIMQLIGGHLADRYPLKPIYVGSFLVQAVVVLLVANAGSLVLVLLAGFSAALSTGALPAENILLARFSPPKHRGLAFGAKYVLAFGMAPLAIWGAARILETTGEYVQLYYAMAGLAVVALACGLLLPGERKARAASPPAEPATQAAE
ncbi:MAG TPA: MFS transporter [Kiloniellales bacterium]|nr:MFS transporter [Kiloniellales bacterium]